MRCAMSQRIDSHQHFWQPARGDYGWMPKDDPTLSRAYAPTHLAPGLKACDVQGSVLVQAAPTVAETEYMLGIADATEHVLAVVGWVDFEAPSSLQTLKRLSAHPKFVGVRPMIQDIDDPDWMLGDDIQWAFDALIELDLTFDALGLPQHMDNFHTLISRYPDLRVVLDHCLKPDIENHSSGSYTQWADRMSKLAHDTNVYCKMSGLVTESASNWQLESLQPYVNHILKEFTPDRVMWGSDWPVVRLRCEYETWFRASNKLIDHLSSQEKAAVLGGTAATFYRLT